MKNTVAISRSTSQRKGFENGIQSQSLVQIQDKRPGSSARIQGKSKVQGPGLVHRAFFENDWVPSETGYNEKKAPVA